MKFRSPRAAALFITQAETEHAACRALTFSQGVEYDSYSTVDLFITHITPSSLLLSSLSAISGKLLPGFLSWFFFFFFFN